MKYLREIARVVSEGAYDAEIIGSRTGWTEQYEEFYRNIRDRSRVVGDASFPNPGRIRKHRIRKRLLNSLFLLRLPSPEFAESTRAFYECNKRLFMVNILIRFSARTVASDLARKTLPITQKYQITNVELGLAIALRAQSHLAGLYRDFEYYGKMVEELLDIQLIENRAVSSYERVTIGFVRHLMAPEKTSDISLECAKGLEQSKCFDRYWVRLTYFRLMVIHYEISGQFDRMIAQCSNALTFLDAHSQLAQPAIYAEFNMQQVVASLFTKQYDLGKAAELRSLQLLKQGTNNWFELMQFAFLLAMHTSRFEEALTIWQDVTTQARYPTPAEHAREKWRIFKMYLDCLAESAELNGITSRHPATVQNYMPKFSKDKHGYNVAIIVVQILFLIESGQFNEVTRHIDALKTYKSRYLRPSVNPRAALFFKLILLLEKESFVFQRIRARSVPLLERLKGHRAELFGDQGGLTSGAV